MISKVKMIAPTYIIDNLKSAYEKIFSQHFFCWPKIHFSGTNLFFDNTSRGTIMETRSYQPF